MGNRSMEGCPLVKYLRESESRKRKEALKIPELGLPGKEGSPYGQWVHPSASEQAQI